MEERQALGAAASVAIVLKLARALAELNPDELTPKSALDTLYKLKALVDKGLP